MADTIYDSGETIFAKGDESRFAYVIREGEVEILEGFPENPIRLALLKKGAIFGEMGLVDERPRLLTARAFTEARVHKIDREGFVDLIRSDPDRALVYLRMFFERLRAMNTRAVLAEETTSGDNKTPVNVTVTLKPKTESAASVVPEEGLLINKFPFRVGRSSGGHDDPMQVNDLMLPDSSPFNVSRNHFSIERKEDGCYVADRGSYLGTIVNNMVIGGHHKGARLKLNEGENDVIVGSRNSPYVFTVHLKSNKEA